MMWKLLSALLLLAGSALADDAAPKQIGSSGNWTAYTMQEGKAQICYALTQPSKQDDKLKGRAKSHLLVTHRPAEKTFNVVSIELGYDVAPDAAAAVTVGKDKDKFDFFTKQQTAWARDADTDKATVTAMAKATDMTVKAKPAKGADTTDSYALAGFPEMLKKIDEACKVKR